MTRSVRVLLGAAAALLLAGGVAAAGTRADRAGPPVVVQPSPAGPYRGLALDPPQPRPTFTLLDTAGRQFDFAARTRGRPTFLYFGYTHCPDQCPTTLADIAAALRQLPAGVRSAVTVVFVTTDPRRDTPAVMGRFLAHFNPSFVGLTGTLAQVVRAQQAAQVPVSAPKAETTKARPASTAHGGGALAYGPDDYAHLTYPAGTSVADLVHDLPRLVSGAASHG